ncbi:hypothetical protein SLEP1_g44377 [Rubroshorea leprosula]|uniref:RBR-type E3 ubiquitin transferase n=1 Tax=Rubroshorea leprosula TaxID=152421 RepID=A0AAV5LGL4_9ROSI|nr:hypothetical protein SLEP1_g44377 [Rubroshorea leprosula]
MGNVLHKKGFQEAEAEAKAEPEPQELELNSEFTCEICVEPVQSTKKFSNNTLCRHPFCIDCIAKYIEARVEDGAPANIKCPALNCNHPLDPLFCRSVIPRKLFNQWCDRLCDTAILEVDKCYCPNNNCSMLVLNECGGTVKKVSCPNCKMTFCFQCKVPWHAGYWCSESGQSRDRNDVLLGMLVELNHWTRCYKCGHAIEKIQGCTEVHCRFVP